MSSFWCWKAAEKSLWTCQRPSVTRTHTCASGCLSMSEGHNALNQGLSHSQPQLLAGAGKLQRENLKPRSSAFAQADLAIGSWWLLREQQSKGYDSTSVVFGMTTHTLICILQQLSLWSWPKCFFIFSPVTI